MRYSSLKLLSYISEAGAGFGRSGTSVTGSPSITKILDKKPASLPKSNTQNKKTYPGVDPRVLGNDPIATLAAQTGEEASNFMLIPQKELPGAGTAAVSTGAGALGLSRTLGAANILQAELDAQQEGVRSMSNVENFYKNLRAPLSPLRPKVNLIQTIKDMWTGPKK